MKNDDNWREGKLNALGWPEGFQANYPWKPLHRREEWEKRFFSRINQQPIRLGIFNSIRWLKPATLILAEKPKPKFVIPTIIIQDYEDPETRGLITCENLMIKLRGDTDSFTSQEYNKMRSQERKWRNEELPKLQPNKYGEYPSFEDYLKFLKRDRRRREELYPKWRDEVLPTMWPNRAGRLPTFDDHLAFQRRERRRQQKKQQEEIEVIVLQ